MTFKIIDVNTLHSQLVTNRDELLNQLEIREKRCKALGETESYLIEHLDRDDSVMENLEFSLPYDGIIDDLLKDFGFKRPSKTNPLRTLTKTSGKSLKNASESPSQHHLSSSPGSTRQKRSLLVLLSLLVAIVSLIFASLSFSQITSLKTMNQSLTKQVKMLQAFEKEKTAIDVFDRYFIPSYYANTRKAVSDFVTEDLKETINVSEGTLQSVILEGITKKGNSYTVTYVLVVKDNKENRANVRLTYSLKKSVKAPYGYLITTQPKTQKYPNN